MAVLSFVLWAADLGERGVPARGLQVHARVRASRLAGLLAGFIRAAAVLAVAVCVFWLLGRGVVGAGAALGVLLAAGFLLRVGKTSEPPFSAIAVDAGGNWVVCGHDGWQAFSPREAWLSPFGWLTLRGAAASQVGGRSLTLTIWRDSVTPLAWRRLRMAAAWSMQRPLALSLPRGAADPRLEASA